jgi:adenine phosphoribosyltransferase
MNKEQLDLKKLIKDVPNFPQNGIIFRDITSLLIHEDGLHLIYEEVFEQLEEYADSNINKIVAIESRGFIIGTIIASHTGLPLVLARKPGKLPNKVLQKKYSSEYSENTLCIQISDIKEGDNVLVVDDVLATGGTVKTTCEIIEALGGRVEACYFLIELDELNGRRLLEDRDIKVISSIHY